MLNDEQMNNFTITELQDCFMTWYNFTQLFFIG